LHSWSPTPTPLPSPDSFEPWSVLGVVAAVAGVAVGLWALVYARRSAHPKQRRLVLEVHEPQPLWQPNAVRRRSRSPDDVADRFVVLIRITNRGRFAISRTDFDDKRPLRLDLGVPLEGPVEVWNPSRGVSVPDIRLTTNAVQVGPGIIPSGASFVVVVKTKGEPRRVGVSRNLLDVPVEIRGFRPGSPHSLGEPQRRSQVALITSIISLLLTASLAGFVLAVLR
jgi:hypothetical protein